MAETEEAVQVETADPMLAMMERDRQRLHDQLTSVPPEDGQGTTDKGAPLPAGEGQYPTSEDGLPVGTGLQDILANLPQEQHDSVRRIFADSTRMKQELAGVESKLESVVEDAVKQAMEDKPIQETQVTEEQMRLFMQIADQLGYAKTEDILADKSSSYLDQANAKGIKEYGDDFGMLDSGGIFILSSHQNKPLTSTYGRLTDPSRGISYRDLHILTHIDQIKQAEYERGLAAASGQSRLQARIPARVEGSPTAVAPAINLRGVPGTASDSSRNVLARALASAKKQMGISS